jgi:4-diphosphocytidyl-2-C-methyl-D-erythritol kinase
MSDPERGFRRARVRAAAKINLDLRVLGKRPDGFHELRTIFQTVSLADIVDIAFAPGRRTEVVLEDDAGIPDNLMARAGRLALQAMRITGRVEMRLRKRIPMGAGLGGGSSDAAAVLLALPALAGGWLSLAELTAIAAQLGSDVPFFLLGGTAVGIGRGTELFPLPDAPAWPAVLVAPGIHVDTPGAYAALSPRLTTESQQNKIVSFQTHVWDLGSGKLAGNDFETVVFERHGRLPALKRALTRAGASFAMMTGSGSALFGLFPTREGASRAWRRLAGGSGLLTEEKAYRVSLVGRARYRSMWRRALAGHVIPKIWPPRSRYLK